MSPVPEQFVDARDRLEERARYNSVARQPARDLSSTEAWLNAISAPLRPPYRAYQRALNAAATRGERVLDVCCGNGWQTELLRQNGRTVVGIDIADEVLRRSSRREPGPRRVSVADANMLPFRDAVFDVVTCAGGFSYFDADSFLREARRVLRPGGKLILVDSFNENPIYRLNRWWHSIRGRRSRSVTARIPNRRTLDLIAKYFGDLETQYFGVLAFFVPVLTRVVGDDRTERMLSASDRTLSRVRRHAFKIVATATRAKHVQESGRGVEAACRQPHERLRRLA